jgi:hypothetical protein
MRRGKAEKWKMEGTLFDSCNGTTLCPCVYGHSADARGLPRHRGVARRAWLLRNENQLDGLNFAGVFYASQNPLMGVDRGAMLVDAKAKPEQRKALETILGGQAGASRCSRRG